MKRFLFFLLGILIFFIFHSCKKNQSFQLAPNVNVQDDIVIAQSAYTWAFNLLIKARLDTALSSTGHSVIDSAVATFQPADQKYSFDYYSVKCCDSVVRRGKIEVEYTGDVLQKGSSCNIFFQNYYEDDDPVSGIDSIVNEGVNSANQMVFKNYITNGLISKYLGGGVISYSAVNHYKAALSSLIPGQDILFLISGNSSGRSSKGYAFTASIQDTLLDSFSCQWIRGGVVRVHVPDVDVTDGTLDFREEDGCSDTIYYNVNGIVIKVLKNKDWLKN